MVPIFPLQGRGLDFDIKGGASLPPPLAHACVAVVHKDNLHEGGVVFLSSGLRRGLPHPLPTPTYGSRAVHSPSLEQFFLLI